MFRTVGKVSLVIGAMAETLVALYENDHRPRAVCPSASSVSGPPSPSVGLTRDVAQRISANTSLL
ncbi:hypothetical protein Z043_106854 [Scleropages formosus]|uniref:Uncharacterized protein n=1 Tax=Scleropages formosus TaxID=113540 RepID=A0A0P7UVJ8_SCLFO|nr:hypothetical protein Z043_106854 [Scleropages formosus]